MSNHAASTGGRFRGSRWQGEVERRATPAGAVGSEPAAMRFDDRLADRQAHAGTLRFRQYEYRAKAAASSRS